MKKQSKINQMLQIAPKGSVLLASWLVEKGYSYSLIQRYKSSGWLVPIERAAYCLLTDNPDYISAIEALQKQARLKVHIAGRSAFALQGMAHYVEFKPASIFLMGSEKTILPTWFLKHDWPVKILYKSNSLLPEHLGIREINVDEVKLRVSNRVRAMMEVLFLAPQQQDISECYDLMDNMNNINPVSVQELLEKCNSFRVKRWFLFLAEQTKQEWFKSLDLRKIDLGSGKRKIDLYTRSFFNSKYNITIPEDWRRDEGKGI